MQYTVHMDNICDLITFFLNRIIFFILEKILVLDLKL